jgi:peptidyl-prolyl cis-trans isomerase C
VVARVNGVEISRAAFEQQRARLLPPGSASDPAFDEAILNSLIEQVLFEQAAAELGVSVTDAQLDDELAAMRAQAEQATPGGWVAWLSANGYAEADLREAVRSSLLAARVRDAVLADAGEVETVRAVRARHILLPTFEEAEAAKVRLQNGEPFDQVALALSRDVSTRASGGDLGFFVREDLTTPELADLAFALEPGQMAGPIQTVLGWHLVETLGFEERPVTDDGRAAAQETVFAAWLSARKAAATIERF